MHRQVQLHLYKFMCTYCYKKQKKNTKQKTFPTAEFFRNLLNIKEDILSKTKFFSANKKGNFSAFFLKFEVCLFVCLFVS